MFYERSDFGGEVGFVFFNVAFWDVDVGCFLDCEGEMLNCRFKGGYVSNFVCCEVFVYVIGETGPVCFFVVGKCSFRFVSGFVFDVVFYNYW